MQMIQQLPGFGFPTGGPRAIADRPYRDQKSELDPAIARTGLFPDALSAYPRAPKLRCQKDRRHPACHPLGHETELFSKCSRNIWQVKINPLREIHMHLIWRA